MVTHRATGSLGYVFIETTRHVPYVHQLTDAEAAAVGRIRPGSPRRWLPSCRSSTCSPWSSGTGVAHFHEHVFVRHVGTPPDLPWGEPWPDAPTGDIESLVDRLRARLVG